MTLENSKRLYDHYVKIGYDKAASDMLSKYPQFAEKPKPAKAKKEEEAKEEKAKE